MSAIPSLRRCIRVARSHFTRDRLVVCAIVFLGALAFLVIEAMDKVESIQKRAPWITKILERRGAFVALLLICFVLLVGDGYELVTKEISEIPASPVAEIKTPLPPPMTITRINPPMKEQCWVKNYAAPALPAPPSWGIATVFCNMTIKPPYSVELVYDQAVAVGPFTFPVGSEFTKSTESNGGSKVVGMFDLHTIIPNEPFSIMARGLSDKLPLVKTATIRAKGFVLEFHP